MLRTEDKLLIRKLKSLPVDFWDFKEQDTKNFTHGLHNYPATMVSPISRNIIKFVQDIQPVKALFDPFAGSGTVLVEGMLANIETIAGNDINPLALLLMRVKTTPINHKQLKKETDALLKRIATRRNQLKTSLELIDSYITNELNLDLSERKGWGNEAPKYLKQFCNENELNIKVPDFKNLGYWFRPRVVLELAIIKTEIEKIKDKNIRDFCLVAFSETIRLVSNRRNGEFKLFRMPAAKVLAFNPDVFKEFEKILLRNMNRMEEFEQTLKKHKAVSKVFIFEKDACTLNDVPNNTYDLVITSPPYGDSRTTVAYGEYSRLSLQWINLSNMSDKEIMSVDKTLMGGDKCETNFKCSLQSPTLKTALEHIQEKDEKRASDVYSFYEDLDKSLKAISEKTQTHGYQFWVVGNRTVKNELLQTDKIITELATQYSLTHMYTIDRNIRELPKVKTLGLPAS